MMIRRWFFALLFYAAGAAHAAVHIGVQTLFRLHDPEMGTVVFVIPHREKSLTLRLSDKKRGQKEESDTESITVKTDKTGQFTLEDSYKDRLLRCGSNRITCADCEGDDGMSRCIYEPLRIREGLLITIFR